MQLAHWTSNWDASPVGRVVVTGLRAVPLLWPTLATCGELEPPHAASPRTAAAASASAASLTDRAYVVVLPGRSCVGLVR